VTARVLVVDDEHSILDVVRYTLEQAGLTVDMATSVESARSKATAGHYDLIVLDVMLPDGSGLDLCRDLRRDSVVPIIMLTARDAEIDRVVGLEMGADDYLVKPFSMAELTSRVRAILRRRELDRSASAPEELLRVGGIVIDRIRHTVDIDGARPHLTPSEFRVLALLATQPERVFTRRQIMEHLWESTYIGDERACDVHISALRRKIEREPGAPQRLLTVRGVGYRLVPA
jgi:DNA-binding response OmpR family regulator